MSQPPPRPPWPPPPVLGAFPVYYPPPPRMQQPPRPPQTLQPVVLQQVPQQIQPLKQVPQQIQPLPPQQIHQLQQMQQHQQLQQRMQHQIQQQFYQLQDQQQHMQQQFQQYHQQVQEQVHQAPEEIEEVITVESLESALSQATDATDAAFKDAAIDVCLGACARALVQSDATLAASAAKIAAKAARLASGTRRLPRLGTVVDSMLNWALDLSASRRMTLGVTESLGNMGEKPWRAEPGTCQNIVDHVDFELRTLLLDENFSNEETAAQRAANLARFLTALLKNAPFPSVDDYSADMLQRLLSRRQSVPDASAWDDLVTELGQALLFRNEKRTAEIASDLDFPNRLTSIVLSTLRRSAAEAMSELDVAAGGGSSDKNQASANKRKAQQRVRRILDRLTKVHVWCIAHRPEKRVSLLAAYLCADFEEDEGLNENGGALFEAMQSASVESREALVQLGALLVGEESSCLDFVARVANLTDDPALYGLALDILFRATAEGSDLEPFALAAPTMEKSQSQWLGFLLKEIKRKGRKQPKRAADAALKAVCEHILLLSDADNSIKKLPNEIWDVVLALLEIGGSAYNYGGPLAILLASSVRTEERLGHATVAARALARLVETDDMTDHALDAAIDAAASLGGGRELVLTRGRDRAVEMCKQIVDAARGIIFATGRLGRAVSFSSDAKKDTPAACLMLSSISNTNKRQQQRKQQTWSLDSLQWAELGAADTDRLEEANVLFESLFSNETIDSTQTQSASNTVFRLPTPPPANAETDGKQVVVTVEATDSSNKRRNRSGKKKKELPVVKKQMVLLQRSPATQVPISPPAPTDSALSTPAATGVISNPSSEPTSPNPVHTIEFKSRICRPDDLARAAARFAVGARLKTRFGSAAKTLAAIRDDVMNDKGTANTVALVSALEREMAAAAELIPRRSSSDANGQDDIVLLFDRETVRPSLALGAFFRQNRAVCDEWLRSVRIPLAELALANRLYADAVHHADCGLLDSNDALPVAALARVVLGDSHGIEAIATESAPASEQWWLKTAADVARGYYEHAYDALVESLFEDSEKLTPISARCGLELLARCGSALGLNDDDDVVPGVSALREMKTLEQVVQPKRAALVLDRWATPPENENVREERVRQWSRVASVGVDDILRGRCIGDEDILTVTSLASRCAEENVALFDFGRKLAVAATTAFNKDNVLKRTYDPGRLLPVLELVQSGTHDSSSSTSSLSNDGEDEQNSEHRILVAARIAVATRRAHCPDLAESALTAVEDIFNAASDLPAWSRGLPVFLDLERSRLLIHNDADQSQSKLLAALDAAVKECTVATIPQECSRSDLLFLSSPGEWLEDTLNDALKSKIISTNSIRTALHQVLQAQSRSKDADFGLHCLAQLDNFSHDDAANATLLRRVLQGAALAAVATVSTSASARLALADWCASAGGLETEAKRNFTAILEAGFENTESARLCAVRAAHLLLRSDDDEWSAKLADSTPAAAWSRLAPQLLANAFEGSSQETTSARSRLLTRVALHSPKSVVHAVVVACREARNKSKGLSPSAAANGGDRKSDDELLTTAATGIEHDEVDDLLQNDDYVDDLGLIPELPRVNSQRKRRATEADTADDEWQRAAVRMRNLRAELALSGESTRELLRGAELCVDELRSLALLPEDKWRQVLASSTLTRLGGPEVATVRIAAGLDSTISGDDQREELAAYRSRALAAPARRHLERAGRELLGKDDEEKSTESQKETSVYRRVFARRARPLLEAAIEALKAVETETRRKVRTRASPFERRFDDAWRRALEAIASLRDTVLDKRGWLAAEVSPALADPVNNIWLPVVRSHQGFCQVSRLSERVAPLASKTRPKKLLFECADAKHRAFLLKGAEDVHLDERVMQLLEVINDALVMNNSSSKPRQQQRRARVATYAVLPLSRVSGLIEWVPTTRPLFELYRAEMNSRATTAAIAERHKLAKKQGGTAATMEYPEPPTIRYDALPRALYAELEKLGVVTHEPRSTWPVDKVRTAFNALADDAPSDLLERELWRGAVDAAAWLGRRHKYATKLGASSIAAFALGLGDRHLENVLFDDADGSVVDVDWGVCFDAGAKLRVPERVPFRLTPVLRKPLYSVRAGTFVDTATSALDALRLDTPGGNSLLQLLELCGHDARVEWRATLGAQQPRPQGHRNSSRPRSRIANERKAGGLALLAAQCLDAKEWCSASLTDRCKRLRDAFSAIQVLSSPRVFCMDPPSEEEYGDASTKTEEELRALVISRQEELETVESERKAAERIALNLSGSRDQARQERAVSCAAIATAAQKLVAAAAAGLEKTLVNAASNDTLPVAQLKARIDALSTPSQQLDLNSIRDGDLALAAGARLSQRSVRGIHKLQKAPGSLFTADDPFFFGVSGQQKTSVNAPWDNVADTTAVHFRRQHGDAKKTIPGAADPEDSDEEIKRLVGFQAECEREAQRLNALGPSSIDALRVTVEAIESYLPFVSTNTEERYSPARLEHAAAVATERRRRVLEAIKVMDRSRAAATLATARGRARRAVRNSSFRLDAINTLNSELAALPRLDSLHVSNNTETLLSVATADATARRQIPRLLMSSDTANIEPGAVANAAACLAFVADADVADAALDGPRGVIFASVCRLEAGHDLALGLSAIVESVPDPNTGLSNKLKALGKACALGATLCRETGRFFASSLFEETIEPRAANWRRALIAQHQRFLDGASGSTSARSEQWRAMAESARENSSSDSAVFRALDALTIPLETALKDVATLCVLDESSVLSLMSEFKCIAMIGVLRARERVHTAGEVVSVPYEALLEHQGAEADIAVAVTNSLRLALGVTIERLLESAVALSQNVLTTTALANNSSVKEGALALAAAAQLQARLDHSADTDYIRRLESALTRRERLGVALVTARAASAATYADKEEVQHEDDDSLILRDEDVVFTSSTLVFRHETLYAGRARRRASSMMKAREIAYQKVKSALDTVDLALSLARDGHDTRMARRGIIDTILSNCMRSGLLGKAEESDATDWTYRIDAHFTAVIPVFNWLEDARAMLKACDYFDDEDDARASSESDDHVIALKLYERYAASEAVARAEFEKAKRRLQNATAAKRLSEELRRALRDLPLTAERLQYDSIGGGDEKVRLASLSRRARRRLQQQQASTFSRQNQQRRATIIPWLELASRCRDLAEHAVLPADSRGNLPPSAKSLSIEAHRLERRFRDLDRIDTELRASFTTEAIRRLVDMPEEDRLALVTADDSRVLFSPGSDIVHQAVSILDEDLPSQLLATFLAIARTSCRAAAAVLEFADLENVQRFDSHIRWNGAAVDELQEADPSSPKPTRPLTTRKDAANLALDAARRKLDASIQGSASDQLNSLIRMATDPNELCLMYEGWAPWI